MPPSYPAATVPPPRKHTGAVVAVAAVAVVVVLILVLGFGGILPIFHSNSKSSNSNGNGGALATYGQAVPGANSSVAGYQGGGWALIAASGFAMSEASTLSLNSVGTSGTCHFIVAPGQNANISVPALSGAMTSGKAPDWGFFYRNGAGEVAVDTYQGGNYNVVGYIATGCSAFGLLDPVPATGAIDSSAALAAVNTPSMLGGFLSSHAVVNMSMALIGGVSFLGYSSGAMWELNATTCPAQAPSSTAAGAWFDASVNATSGAVVAGTGSSGSGSCSTSSSSPTTTTYQLGLGQGPTNTVGGTYFDSLVMTTTNGLNTTYLQFEITNAGGTPIFGGDPVTTGAGANCLVGEAMLSCTATSAGQPAWYIAIEGPGGNVEAVYNPVLASWTTAGGAPVFINSAETLVIISGTQLYLTGATLSAASDSSSVIISGSATL